MPSERGDKASKKASSSATVFWSGVGILAGIYVLGHLYVYWDYYVVRFRAKAVQEACYEMLEELEPSLATLRPHEVLIIDDEDDARIPPELRKLRPTQIHAEKGMLRVFTPGWDPKGFIATKKLQPDHVSRQRHCKIVDGLWYFY